MFRVRRCNFRLYIWFFILGLVIISTSVIFNDSNNVINASADYAGWTTEYSNSTYNVESDNTMTINAYNMSTSGYFVRWFELTIGQTYRILVDTWSNASASLGSHSGTGIYISGNPTADVVTKYTHTLNGDWQTLGNRFVAKASTIRVELRQGTGASTQNGLTKFRNIRLEQVSSSTKGYNITNYSIVKEIYKLPYLGTSTDNRPVIPENTPAPSGWEVGDVWPSSPYQYRAPSGWREGDEWPVNFAGEGDNQGGSDNNGNTVTSRPQASINAGEVGLIITGILMLIGLGAYLLYRYQRRRKFIERQHTINRYKPDAGRINRYSKSDRNSINYKNYRR